MNKRKVFYLVFGCAVAATALWFCFREVSMQEVRASFSGVRVGYLVPTLVLFFLFYSARALRWSVFCRPLKPVSARRLFGPLLLGHLTNILPFHAGNWVRAVLLTTREKIRFSASLGTVVMETLLDVFMLVVLLCSVLILFPSVLSSEAGIAGYLHSAGVSLATTLAALVVLCFLLVYRKERTLKVLLFPVRAVSQKAGARVEKALSSFSRGLEILRRPPDLFQALALSVLSVIFFILSVAPLYFAFHLSWLPPGSMLLLFVSVYICVIVMPTPAYLGSFQLGVVLVLVDLYGVDPARAAVFAMTYWACYIGAIFLFSMAFLVRDQVPFFALIRSARAGASADPGRSGDDGIDHIVKIDS